MARTLNDIINDPDSMKRLNLRKGSGASAPDDEEDDTSDDLGASTITPSIGSTYPSISDTEGSDSPEYFEQPAVAEADESISNPATVSSSDIPANKPPVNPFEEAQDAARMNRLMAGLGKSAAMIGHGFAQMRQQKAIAEPDTSVYDNLAKTADSPVKELLARNAYAKNQRLEKQAQDRNNPSSAVNTKFRDTIKSQYGINLPDNMTADEAIQHLLPFQKLKQHEKEVKIKQDYYAEAKRASAAERKDRADASLDARYQSILSRDPEIRQASSKISNAQTASNMLDKLESGDLASTITAKEIVSMELAQMASPGTGDAATRKKVNDSISNLATDAEKAGGYITGRQAMARLKPYLPYLKQEVDAFKHSAGQNYARAHEKVIGSLSDKAHQDKFRQAGREYLGRVGVDYDDVIKSPKQKKDEASAEINKTLAEAKSTGSNKSNVPGKPKLSKAAAEDYLNKHKNYPREQLLQALRAKYDVQE